MALTVRQEINILTSALSGATAANSNEIVQVDTTKYVNPTFYFEAVISGAASNTGTVTLRRGGTTTDDASLTGRTTGTLTLVRSSAFTPPAGQTEYVVRNNADGTRSQTIKAARIVVVDNIATASAFDVSQTQVEVGDTGTSTSLTAAALAAPKYWKYDSTSWSATVSASFEAVVKSSSTKSTVTALLQRDDGSFASWTTAATVTTTSITPTRLRATFTPTSGRNYRVALLTDSTKSAVTLYGAKVVVDQAPASTSVDQQNPTGGGMGGSTLLTCKGTTSSVDSRSFGQSFVAGNSYPLANIQLTITKVGSPTDNIYAEVLSGAINGTLLGTSANVDGSTLPTTSTANTPTFDFSAAGVTLTAGTAYYVRVWRSGANDSTNYYQGWASNTAAYTSGSSYYLDGTGAWQQRTTSDLVFTVTAGPIPLTLVEAQYLLLNTADTGTGLQNSLTLYDAAEWSGAATTFKHAIDSDNASNAAKLVDITNATTDVTSSTVTGANQQTSGALTFISGNQLDVNVTNSTGAVAASRILVAVSPATATAASPAFPPPYRRIQHLMTR